MHNEWRGSAPSRASWTSPRCMWCVAETPHAVRAPRVACTLGKGLRLALDLGYDRCLDTAKVGEESGASPSVRELDARPVEWDGVLHA